MGSFLPMLVVMGGLLFFMNRTQKKQQKERQNLLDSISAGDKVVTIGGLHGIVAEVRNEGSTNTILIDCEGIFLEFDRSAIKTIVPGERGIETEEDSITEEVKEVVIEDNEEELVENTDEIQEEHLSDENK